MEQLALNRAVSIFIGCIFIFISSTSMAQPNDESTATPALENDTAEPAERLAAADVDEILYVTGSYIKGLRQEDLASPLQSFDRSAISDIGGTRMADLINTLTINTGSENNPDGFTQNFTTGTSNINLRGLGVASTLVLLNGQRQTYAGFTTDTGENFVDTASLVPMIAVDRVEILKDGAASLYGSDAVAGVVNFITRNDFEGVEFEVESQTGEDQGSYTISGIYGVGNESTHFMAAFSFLDRDELSTAERRLSVAADDTSRAGFPGSFLAPTQPTTPGLDAAWTAFFDSAGNVPGIADFFEVLLPGGMLIDGALQPAFADPDCVTIAATDDTTIPPATFPLGACEFDFGAAFSLVPEEERSQVYASVTHDFSENTRFFAEISLANNEAARSNSPSFPITSTPLICGDGSLDALLGGSCAALGPHPDNPFGIDVLFVGRVLGSGAPPSTSIHDSDTTRLAFGFSGTMNNGWSWNVDYTQSENEFLLEVNDTLGTEFQNALVGLGGEDCVGVPGVDIFPGVGPCSYFNPFGSSLTGTGTANTQEIFDYITGRLSVTSTAELSTLSGLISGELFDMAGGKAGIAIGAQIRDESLDTDYDENSNIENFLFLVGNPDFNTDRDIQAAYVELALPLSERLNVQLSARYEDYEDAGDSTDPKIGVLWRPSDTLSIRGSFGTSFRAPSIFQQNGIQTTLEQISTPTLGAQFIAVRSQPDPTNTLEPEEADVMNLGISWQDIEGAFNVHLDYWAYDYDNVIIQQNPQAVFNLFLAGDPSVADQIVLTSSNTISRINVFYDNASTLETDGIDLGGSYTWNTSSGIYRFGGELTRVLTYDIEDPQAGNIDGLGQRNFNNFATSVPELRANLHFHWRVDHHSVNAFLRHIDSYVNDQFDAAGVPLNENISSHTTYDLQYNYHFKPIGDADEGITLSVGGINVTDEEPPYVATNGGYDSKVHDPRGAIYYVKANVPF